MSETMQIAQLDSLLSDKKILMLKKRPRDLLGISVDYCSGLLGEDFR